MIARNAPGKDPAQRRPAVRDQFFCLSAEIAAVTACGQHCPLRCRPPIRLARGFRCSLFIGANIASFVMRLQSGCLKIISFVFRAFVLPQRTAHPSRA